jgi:hypothetical protein
MIKENISAKSNIYKGNFNIYPVSEGYLRKIPVERRSKYPEPL